MKIHPLLEASLAALIAVMASCGGTEAEGESAAEATVDTLPLSVPAPQVEDGLLIVSPESVREWQESGTEFVLVDAEKGTKAPAFDHKKLAAALSKASGKEYAADRLPFDEIEYRDGGQAVRFEAAGAAWTCDLDTYECVRGKQEAGVRRREQEQDSPDRQPRRRGQPPDPSPRSPDGKWTARIEGENVCLRDADGKEVTLT